MNILILLLLSLITAGFEIKPEKLPEEICLSDAEKGLYELIMEYRREKKLKSIPLSAALTKVAQTHVEDLNNNFDFNNKRCNTHSWSKDGEWSSCCYTEDHKKAECMWNKPQEIAGYASKGYEIVSWEFPNSISPEVALHEWQISPGHNALLVNSGVFQQANWMAIGIGVSGNYAAVWFGVMEDKNVDPALCD